MPFSQLSSLLWLCTFLNIIAWHHTFYIDSNQWFLRIIFFWWEKNAISIIHHIMWYNHFYICKLQTVVCHTGWQSSCISVADTCKHISRMLTDYLCVWGRVLPVPCVQSISLMSVFSFAAVLVGTQWFLSCFPISCPDDYWYAGYLHVLATKIWIWKKVPIWANYLVFLLGHLHF